MSEDDDDVALEKFKDMLAELVNFNGGIADQYERLMEHMEDEDDLDRAAQLLLASNEIKKSTEFLYAEMSARFAKLMGNRPEVVSGGTTIEKKTGAPRKSWQHAALINTIMQRITDSATNLDTGEIDLTPREAVDKLLKFAHVDYYRVTELKKLDINADLYSTTDESQTKTSIIIRKG